MILTLVSPDNPILSKKVENFNFKNPPTDPNQLARDLYETLMNTSYIGLSAPQVGLPYRAFALRTVPGIVCYNPRVVDVSTEQLILDETCLTFKHLSLPIKRPKMIKVRYAEPNGQVKTETYTGLTARYFLHELDHLDGILYTSKAKKFHLERAQRKQTHLNRETKRKSKELA